LLQPFRTIYGKKPSFVLMVLRASHAGFSEYPETIHASLTVCSLLILTVATDTRLKEFCLEFMDFFMWCIFNCKKTPLICWKGLRRP